MSSTNSSNSAIGWVVMICLALVISLVIFSVCGAGGGMMMLVLLNGYTSSDPLRPVFVIFALSVLLVNLGMISAINLLARHLWFPQLPLSAVFVPALLPTLIFACISAWLIFGV